MDACGKEYHFWVLGESLSHRSVFYQVLDAVSDEVFKRKCLMEKWYFILKTIGTEKDMRTSGFYRYKHRYTYRRQEFPNTLEKSNTIVSDSCYLSTKKNVEHGIGPVVGACEFA